MLKDANLKDSDIKNTAMRNNDTVTDEQTPKCRHCGCTECVSHGKTNGKIRYLCKGCKRHFTLNDRRVRHNIKEIELALLLYNGNVSMRGIQSTLNKFFDKNIPFCVIDGWINNISGRLDYYKTNKEIKENKIKKEEKDNGKEEEKEKLKIPILEMDELWKYHLDEKSKMKKSSKYGLLLIGNEIKLLRLA